MRPAIADCSSHAALPYHARKLVGEYAFLKDVLSVAQRSGHGSIVSMDIRKRGLMPRDRARRSIDRSVNTGKTGRRANLKNL
jgi:hypothetical protein